MLFVVTLGSKRIGSPVPSACLFLFFLLGVRFRLSLGGRVCMLHLGVSWSSMVCAINLHWCGFLHRVFCLVSVHVVHLQFLCGLWFPLRGSMVILLRCDTYFTWCL